MKNIIVAWCKTNEIDFENFVPIKFIGTRNKKLGLSNDFNILFLSGFSLLSDSYKRSLIDLGFILHDVSSIYDEFEKKYFQSNRFSDYAKKCFLRWLVIDKFFNGEEIIHYDGDIVFNEDPKIIAQKLKGKTFILQGCPAFAVISNADWFKQYEEHLGFFAKDIEGYCEKAWEERAGWDVTFKTRWAGSRFSKIFLHDQDFISHLIHRGKIIQDPVEEVMFALRDYIFFENPLFVHSYDENFPYSYSREKGIDYLFYNRDEVLNKLYKKKILFWHMQSCFNFYLAKFILRRKVFRFLPLGGIKLNLFKNDWEDRVNKKMAVFFKHTNRLDVYKYFFEKNDFSRVLRNNIWWKNGIFK